MNRLEKRILLATGLLLVLEYILLMNLPFFWDGISKAYRASWIYENNFSTLIVPTEINSGHPPLWITLIALFWTLFGKTLWVARLLLLLVNAGVFYQLFLLCKKRFTAGVSLLFFFLVALDPTLIAQSTILNNDMLLLFFLLLGLNSLFTHKWIWYSVAITGLLLTNLRGIYCIAAFGLIHILLVRFADLEYHPKTLRAYGLGLLAFGVFLVVQYGELGWVLISKNENFAPHREAAGVERIAKNAAAFVKNLLDFGRIVIWIPLGLLLLRSFRNKKLALSVNSKKIFIPLVVFTLVFFLGFVPFSNPMGPRYLMICFLLATILLVNLLYEHEVVMSTRKIVITISSLSLIAGHFWIYPAKIAQGWDSSLAYLNYFSVEEQMLAFIVEANIPNDKIGTHLALNSKHMSTLNEANRFDPKFAKPDFESNPYFLFSNIENRTKDDGIEKLRTQWEEVAHFSQLGVYMKLYKRK